ncbi:hypothetical protein LKL48_15655, partial [Listeria monocytogenes]|nr:hypothetical protein [Listeria monocytogenes]
MENLAIGSSFPSFFGGYQTPVAFSEGAEWSIEYRPCLLYTSDAADDLTRVHLRGSSGIDEQTNIILCFYHLISQTNPKHTHATVSLHTSVI